MTVRLPRTGRPPTSREPLEASYPRATAADASGRAGRRTFTPGTNFRLDVRDRGAFCFVKDTGNRFDDGLQTRFGPTRQSEGHDADVVKEDGTLVGITGASSSKALTDLRFALETSTGVRATCSSRWLQIGSCDSTPRFDPILLEIGRMCQGDGRLATRPRLPTASRIVRSAAGAPPQASGTNGGERCD
jgi:hypothetical protein